jgi:carbamoyltransferase
LYILGINAYHGDASATVIRAGKLLAAAEEERFNRFKHCAGFPTQAIKYCLEAAGISIEQVAHIGISRNPSANLRKKAMFAAKKAARGTGLLARAAGPARTSGRQSGLKRLTERLASVAKVRNFKDDLATGGAAFY